MNKDIILTALEAQEAQEAKNAIVNDSAKYEALAQGVGTVRIIVPSFGLETVKDLGYSYFAKRQHCELKFIGLVEPQAFADTITYAVACQTVNKIDNLNAKLDSQKEPDTETGKQRKEALHQCYDHAKAVCNRIIDEYSEKDVEPDKITELIATYIVADTENGVATMLNGIAICANRLRDLMKGSRKVKEQWYNGVTPDKQTDKERDLTKHLQNQLDIAMKPFRKSRFTAYSFHYVADVKHLADLDDYFQTNRTFSKEQFAHKLVTEYLNRRGYELKKVDPTEEERKADKANA